MCFTLPRSFFPRSLIREPFCNVRSQENIRLYSRGSAKISTETNQVEWLALCIVNDCSGVRTPQAALYSTLYFGNKSETDIYVLGCSTHHSVNYFSLINQMPTGGSWVLHANQTLIGGSWVLHVLVCASGGQLH